MPFGEHTYAFLLSYIPRSDIAGSFYSLICTDIIKANNNCNKSFMENNEDSHMEQNFSSLD